MREFGRFFPLASLLLGSKEIQGTEPRQRIMSNVTSMKPKPLPPDKRSSLHRLVCVSALFTLALATANPLAAPAPYNVLTYSYPDVDLSVRSTTNAITWLAHTNTNPVLHGQV